MPRDLFAMVGLSGRAGGERASAEADLEPTRKEEQLYEALRHYGFPRLCIQGAIEALGDHVATESLSNLTRAARAILAGERPGSPLFEEPAPERGAG